MTGDVSRRAWLGACLTFPALRAVAAFRDVAADDARLASIEQRLGGRVGVSILDIASGRRIGHRASERFPLCSTFKLLAAAAVLSRVDAGQEQLDRFVRYGRSDLLEYAPVAKQHVGEGGMTVEAVLAAAVEYSDNTAGNLALAAIGGPAALTAYVRRLGDAVTRLDRTEPELNVVSDGDVRDTTAPAAMVEDVKALLWGSALSAGSRQRLTGWLVANTTGNDRLRAGLPKEWRVGDKTGSGPHGEANDVAIAWPPGRAPIVIAAYSVSPAASADARNAALADVGRIAAAFATA